MAPSNFLEIPQGETSGKGLNLISRFFYLPYKGFEDKKFGFSYNFNINGTIVKFNFKFPLKTPKLVKGNTITIEVPIYPSKKWVLFRFNPVDFINKHFKADFTSIGAIKSENIFLKSIELRCHMLVRGVFLSNNEFTYSDMPKEMSTKEQNIAKVMDFLDLQFVDFESKKSPFSNVTIVEQSSDEILDNLLDDQFSNLSKITGKKNVDSKQQITTFVGKIDSNFKQTEVSGMKQEANTSSFQKQLEYSELKETNSHQLREKMEKVNKEVFDKRDLVRSIISSKQERKHTLLPDPIMNLAFVLGYSAKVCPTVKFSSNNDKSQALFVNGTMIINYDFENIKQRFFYGHSKPITFIVRTNDNEHLFSAQEGKNCIIRVWKAAYGRCCKIITTPFESISSLSVSRDDKLFVVVGKISYNKEMIFIYDISNIEDVKILIKQGSQFSVNSLKFSVFDNQLMLSCGKENIKFWRIKDNHLGGKAVVLNQYARGTNFICIDFDNPFLSEKSKGKALVGSNTGCIFQVSCSNQELEAIFKLHDSPILSIALNDAFCVTGSEDGVVRVWPIDFSEFLIEAKHEAPVVGLDISFDSLDIICGSKNGSLGMLNIQSKKYKTLLRSPPSKVLNMYLHPNLQYLMTIESDNSIRIWDIEEKSESFQFFSNTDAPICLDAPRKNIFAAGFESGTIKVFDLENTCIVYECTAFCVPVSRLKFTHDGARAVAVSSEGNISIHESKDSFMMIKQIKIDGICKFCDLSIAPKNDYFATIGEDSSCALVWNLKTFGVKNQIYVASHFITGLHMINKDLLAVILDNCSVQFYSLVNQKGRLVREFSNIHLESVNSFSASRNFKYFFSGGEEGIVKVFDFKMLFKQYNCFQQFIGHSEGLRAVLPIEQKGMVVTVSENDGIFFWNFLGDLTFTDSETISELDKVVCLTEKQRTQAKLIERNPDATEDLHREKSFARENNQRFAQLRKNDDGMQSLTMLPIEEDIAEEKEETQLTKDVSKLLYYEADNVPKIIDKANFKSFINQTKRRKQD